MYYLILISSVLVGAIIALYFKGMSDKKTRLLISFSGSYLFAITVLHLIPDIYSHGADYSIGIYIIIGFFFQIILEHFTKGAEHGHSHFPGSIPLSVLIGLSIHAILEGMPLGNHDHGHVHGNLLTGLAIHKIPVSIVLMNMMLAGGFSKTKSIIIIILFAFMSPLGMFTSEFINVSNYHNEIMAIVIGIFLHISTTILFESSDGHDFNKQKMISIILGTVIAILGLSI
jgi:zinc transporter ZupT